MMGSLKRKSSAAISSAMSRASLHKSNGRSSSVIASGARSLANSQADFAKGARALSPTARRKVGQNKKSLKETVAEIVADSEPMSPEPSHEADSKDASPNPPELPKHSALPERGSRPAQYRLEQQESGVKMMTSGRTGLIDRHATMGMFTDYAPPDQEPEPEEGMQRRHSGAKKQEEPDALKNMQFNRLMYTDYLEKIRPQVANTASTTINKVKAAKRAQRTREMAQTGTDVAMFSHRNMQARKPTDPVRRKKAIEMISM